jgi:hypothetical protein
MFAPKKTIPKLVIGMLALTGCATTTDNMPGGSGGDGGSGGTAGTGGTGGMAGMGGSGGEGGVGGSDLTNAWRAYCVKATDCSGSGSADGCFDYYVAAWLSGDAGCQAAVISYSECALEHEGCDFSSACGDYLDALRDACN